MLSYYSLLSEKKSLKLFGRGTWCTKKHFGHRVAHHGYIFTSCLGYFMYAGLKL